MQSHELFDVTLVCEDKTKFKAHQFVMYACSPVFQSIINDLPHKDPVIYLTLQEQNWQEQNRQFKHLLVIQLSQKYLSFPRTLWGCLSYPFGGSKQPKMGFL